MKVNPQDTIPLSMENEPLASISNGREATEEKVKELQF
jgi:hypothetical protein